MAPTRFLIVLESPNAAFSAGEIISGKVILVLDKEQNTQGVTLKFMGEAKVGWQEHHGQGTTRGYSSNELYFEKTIFVLGDGQSDTLIPSGDHEYRFRFQLPKILPSSFEGKLGSIRYGMEAVVKRSWKFDHSTQLAFTVNSVVDLNLQPVYAEPREVFEEKSVGCLCFKQGPISMKVELPRSGYVPGEYLKFAVFATNSSSRPVTAILVNFVKENIYRTHSRTRRMDEEEILEIEGPTIQPFQSESWETQFQLPPLLPSNLGGSKIIGLSYYLKFQLDIPSSLDLRMKIPIIVGTVPYVHVRKEDVQEEYFRQETDV